MNCENSTRIKQFGYYWLDGWIIANIIQLATQDFCTQFLNRTNDTCGRQYDQMTQAARSVQANIAEGSSRHYTSKETEMKLTDVARASLAELSGDYLNFLLRNNKVPWSIKSEEYKKVADVTLDKPAYKEDVQHLSSLHILAQKRKFDTCFLSNDKDIVCNCLIILRNRLISMLNKQIAKQIEVFKQEGGFTESLTADRLATRAQQSKEEGAPLCPLCGSVMMKRTIKKGANLGSMFWGCSKYPKCRC